MKKLYTSICLMLGLLFATSACQQEISAPEETASLSLHFNLTPASVSRGVGEETINLYYEVKDGVMTLCEAPESMPESRAGDGNTADGGGMANLSVFIVDGNDDIVARKSFSNLGNATSQTMNFLDLQPGEYTAYAYANTEGNDWFTMPSESETSFAGYKDALLKGLSGSTPTIQNGRMPLTGKQAMSIGGGNNVRTISMLRPVGKLSVTIQNQKTSDAVTITDMSLGDARPHTGYVFKHDAILPNSATNTYYPLKAPNTTHNIFPASSQLVFETLLYETEAEDGFKYSFSRKGTADYDFQENMANQLNAINKNDQCLIKIKDQDLFLSLRLVNGTYQLHAVPASDLDENCYWKLSTGGQQQRELINDKWGVGLDMSGGTLSFKNNSPKLRYSGGQDYTIISLNTYQLTYNNNGFRATATGTHFQFYTFTKNSDGGIITPDPFPILVQNIINDEKIPLTTIHRNQHIQLNIIFK